MKIHMIAALVIGGQCVSYAVDGACAAPVPVKKPMASYAARYAQEHERWRAAYRVVRADVLKLRSIQREASEAFVVGSDLHEAYLVDGKKAAGLTPQRWQNDTYALALSNRRLRALSPVPRKVQATSRLIYDAAMQADDGVMMIYREAKYRINDDGLPLLQRAANRLQTARARLVR